MTKVYACLAGEWVCLNDDPDCVMGTNRQAPYIWWEEGAEIYFSAQKNNSEKDTMYHLNYVQISYKGKDYRISPIFLQIVNG